MWLLHSKISFYGMMGLGGCEGKGRARGGCMGKKRRVKGCKWVWGV